MESSNSLFGKVWRRFRRLTGRQLVVLIIIVGLLAGGGFFAYKYDQANKEAARLSANPQEAARKEVQQITDKVGTLIVIPRNETPTLATVSDASKLKNQAFFAKAQNGDKVLIFTQAKRAILYRPATNKIIEVAPVNLGNGALDPAPAQ